MPLPTAPPVQPVPTETPSEQPAVETVIEREADPGNAVPLPADSGGGAADDFFTGDTPLTFAVDVSSVNSRGGSGTTWTSGGSSASRSWSYSPPDFAFEFELSPVSMDGTMGFNLDRLEQVGVTVSFGTAHPDDDSSAMPEELQEMIRRLMSPAGTVGLTGAVFSAGLVWWASRAGGLLASLALSAPTWRGLDPLNIVGRTPDDPDDWGSAPDADEERSRDERAVTGMLDDMTNHRR